MHFTCTIDNADGHKRTVTIGSGGADVPIRLTALSWSLDNDDDIFTPIRSKKGKVSVVNQHTENFYEQLAGTSEIGNSIRIVRDDGFVELSGFIINEQRDMADFRMEDEIELNFVSRLGIAERKPVQILDDTDHLFYTDVPFKELIAKAAISCDFSASDKCIFNNTFVRARDVSGERVMDIRVCYGALCEENYEEDVIISGDRTSQVVEPMASEIFERIAMLFGGCFVEYGNDIILTDTTGEIAWQYFEFRNGFAIHDITFGTMFEPEAGDMTKIDFARTSTQACNATKVVVNTSKTKDIFTSKDLEFDYLTIPGTNKPYKRDHIATDSEGKTSKYTDYFYVTSSKNSAIDTYGVLASGGIPISGSFVIESVAKKMDDEHGIFVGKSILCLIQPFDVAQVRTVMTARLPLFGVARNASYQQDSSQGWAGSPYYRTLHVKASVYAVNRSTNRFVNAEDEGIIVKFRMGTPSGQDLRYLNTEYKKDGEGLIKKCTIDAEVDLPVFSSPDSLIIEIEKKKTIYDALEIQIADISMTLENSYTPDFEEPTNEADRSNFVYSIYNLGGGEEYKHELKLEPYHASFTMAQRYPLMWPGVSATCLDYINQTTPGTGGRRYEVYLAELINKQMKQSRPIDKVTTRIGSLAYEIAGKYPLPILYAGTHCMLSGIERDYMENTDKYELQKIQQ